MDPITQAVNPLTPAVPPVVPDDPASVTDPKADPAPAALTRPENIPDEFWNDETGFKHDDVFASMNDLKAKNAEFTSKAASAPESADAYEAKLPEDFKLPEGFELPEGQEAVGVDPDDPRLAMARDLAFKNGWSQAEFESVVAMGVHADISGEQAFQGKLKEQADLLGSRFKERIGAVTDWLTAKLPEAQSKALIGSLQLADSVQAFEAIMSIARSDPPGNPGGGRDVNPIEISDEDWDKMSASQKINHARNSGKK